MRFITSDGAEDRRLPKKGERYLVTAAGTIVQATRDHVPGEDGDRIILHPIPDDAVVVSREVVERAMRFVSGCPHEDVSATRIALVDDLDAVLANQPAPDPAPMTERVLDAARRLTEPEPDDAKGDIIADLRALYDDLAAEKIEGREAADLLFESILAVAQFRITGSGR